MHTEIDFVMRKTYRGALRSVKRVQLQTIREEAIEDEEGYDDRDELEFEICIATVYVSGRAVMIDMSPTVVSAIAETRVCPDRQNPDTTQSSRGYVMDMLTASVFSDDTKDREGGWKKTRNKLRKPPKSIQCRENFF